MKSFLFALLIALSICSADVCNPPPTSGIFKIICELDKKQNTVKSSMDSLKSPEKLYSEAFTKIQNSYNTFLIIVGIFVAIVGVIVTVFGGIGVWNWWKGKRYNEEAEKEFKKIKGYIYKIGENFLLVYSGELNNSQDDFEKAKSMVMIFTTAIKLELNYEETKNCMSIIKMIINDKNFGTSLEEVYKGFLINSALDFEDYCYRISNNIMLNDIKEIISILTAKFGKEIKFVEEIREEERIKKERSKPKE